jgi:hypothetical protein
MFYFINFFKTFFSLWFLPFWVRLGWVRGLGLVFRVRVGFSGLLVLAFKELSDL